MRLLYLRQFLAARRPRDVGSRSDAAKLSGEKRSPLVGKAEDKRSIWLEIGGRRMIITEARLRIEGSLGLTPAPASELTVRSLGGVIDGVGEFVDGQAAFGLAQACVVFLQHAPDGSSWVTGMAHGHYPLTAPTRGTAACKFGSCGSTSAR